MTSRVTILGSGTCVPSLTRNPCSFLMQIGNENLLFDCGSGVMRRLLEIGVPVFQVSHLFISHFHPDHTGELVSILFALKTPSPPVPTRPLTLVAGKGFRSFFQGLQSVYGQWIELPPGRLRIIELDTDQPDRHTFPTFSVASAPVAHRPESLAYRIEDPAGKSLVYSGDTDVCDRLIDLAAGADVMICESAFPDNHKTDGHLTPSLAGRMAQAAGVKRLVLTHFYPACDDVDIEKQCRSTYSRSVVLAHDLMSFGL